MEMKKIWKRLGAVLLTAALCLAVLLGGQDFVHALLNVAVLP